MASSTALSLLLERLQQVSLIHGDRLILGSDRQIDTEEVGDGEVNAAIHEPKRVRRAHDTIELRQRLEPPLNHRDLGKLAKRRHPSLAERLLRIDENQGDVGDGRYASERNGCPSTQIVR